MTGLRAAIAIAGVLVIDLATVVVTVATSQAPAHAPSSKRAPETSPAEGLN